MTGAKERGRLARKIRKSLKPLPRGRYREIRRAWERRQRDRNRPVNPPDTNDTAATP